MGKKLIIISVIALTVLLLFSMGVSAKQDRVPTIEEKDRVPTIEESYQYLDYEEPSRFQTMDDSYTEYCERDGYSLQCAFQVEFDDDYECEQQNNNKIVCTSMESEKKITYKSKFSNPNKQEKEEIFEEYGIPIIDYRRYMVVEHDGDNHTYYYTEYLSPDEDLDIDDWDIFGEGFVQIGFNSNVFYYTDMSYGVGFNTTVGTVIEPSNNQYDCQGDPNVVACFHFNGTLENAVHDSQMYTINSAYQLQERIFLNDYPDAMRMVSSDEYINATNFSIAIWTKAADSFDADFDMITILHKTGTYQVTLDTHSDDEYRARIDTAAQSNQILGPIGDFTDKEWHLLVLTFNNDTNNATLYFDGTTETDSRIINGIVDITTRRLVMTNTNPTGSWVGELDELIVWNKTLNSTEVQDLYDNGLFMTGESDDVYFESVVLDAHQDVNWTNFTYLADEEANDSFTMKVREIDFAKTDINDPDLLAFFSTDDLEQPDYDTDQLMLYYPFDDNFLDYSGNGFHATNRGSVRYGDATYLDGDGDDIVIPIEVFDNMSTNGTLSIWVNGEYPGMSWSSFRLFGSDDTRSVNYEIRNYDAMNCKLYMGNGTYATGAGACAGGLRADTWTMLTWTWEYDPVANQTDVKGYENGNYISHALFDSVVGYPNDEFQIGRFNTDYIYSYVDEVLMYNKTLNTTELEELYEKGRATFTEPVESVEFGSSQWFLPGYFYDNTSFHFGIGDVSDNHDVFVMDDDYYFDNLNFSDEDFTISAFVKPVHGDLNARSMMITSYGRLYAGSTTARGGWEFYLGYGASYGGEYRPVFAYYNSSWSDLQYVSCSANQIEPDIWHHVAVTNEFNASSTTYNSTLYVDGVYCTSKTLYGEIPQPQGTSPGRIQPCIGADGYDCNSTTKNNEFVGEIDDVAFYSGLLTLDEMIDYADWSGHYNPGEQFVENITRFLQYQMFFYNNDTYSPLALFNVTFNYGIPTEINTIPTLELPIGHGVTYDLSSYINIGDGFQEVCSGAPNNTVTSWNGCTVEFNTPHIDSLIGTSEVFLLTANNGYGEDSQNVTVEYVQDLGLDMGYVVNSMSNMIRWWPLIGTILGSFFVLLMIVGFFKTNKIKVKRKQFKYMIVAFVTIFMVVAVGLMIFQKYIMPSFT